MSEQSDKVKDVKPVDAQPQAADAKKKLEKERADEKESKRVKDILSEYPNLKISVLSPAGAQPVVVRATAKHRTDLTVADVRSVARRLAAPVTGDVVQVEITQQPGPYMTQNGDLLFSMDPKKVEGYMCEAMVSSATR